MKKRERVWTKAEDDFLIRVYPMVSKEILAPRIDRTAEALRKRASNLGIPGPKHHSVPRWRIDKKTGCWNWIGAKSQGYGVMRKEKKTVLAHRYNYEEKKGKIPKGMFIDHLCRNPTCVNPDHLEVVTPRENVRRGNCTKLTPEQVLEIRKNRNVDRGVLAARFSLKKDTITGIWAGETWKELINGDMERGNR
jgi:hypothetical protein